MDFLELLRPLVAVGAVLAALAGLLQFARKKAEGIDRSRNIKLAVVARVGLTPNHQLHLLQTEHRTFLIATHQSGCTLIDSDEGGVPAAREIRAVGAGG